MKAKARLVENLLKLKRKYQSLDKEGREKMLEALGSKNAEYLLKHVSP